MGGVATGVSQCASALVHCWSAWQGASLGDQDSLPGQRGMSAICFLGPSRLLCEARENSTTVSIKSIRLKRSVVLSAILWASFALDSA